MKKDWQRKLIRDLCEVIAGQSPDGIFYNYDGKGMPFYQGKKDFGEKFIEAPTTWTTQTTKLVRDGDILMSVRAPVGPVNFATDEACIGRGLAAIRSGTELNRDFLFYQLLHLQPDIAGREGAVFASINKSEIEALPLAYAPLPTQQRIVSILDEAFAAIAKAKQNAEKNLQNARELFESYLQNIFANPGDKWEEKKLGEVLQRTETTNPTDNPDREFVYIDVSSVDNKGFTIENTTLLKGANAPSRARKLIRNGDVIFATVRPTLRRIAVISKEYNGQVCSTGYFVLRAKDQINNRLLFYFLQTNSFNESMEKLQKGASYPAVTDNDVREQIINFPHSLPEQQRIVSKLDNLSNETKNLESIYQKKLADLEELKKSILQKAFSGELTG